MHRTALAAGLLFASGACGLVYEVAWARQLGPLLGHTADAAAVVVASYFVGLAAGAAIGGRLAVRMRRPLLGYAIAEAIAALWALALAPLLELTGAASLAQTLHDAGPATKLVARAGVALVALLLVPVLRDACLALGWARRTGGRFDEKGGFVLDDGDRTAALRHFAEQLPREARVGLHPSTAPTWVFRCDRSGPMAIWRWRRK